MIANRGVSRSLTCWLACFYTVYPRVYDNMNKQVQSNANGGCRTCGWPSDRKTVSMER